ncbi:MAG: hypothetical protein M1327_03640 [Candidatus Thermoplasmatota archaeon]|nr:hypothetical protein [Candidatus Thermoplasmatota archaeon]
MTGPRKPDILYLALFSGIVAIFLVFINYSGIFIRSGTGSVFVGIEVALLLAPILIFIPAPRVSRIAGNAVFIFYIALGALLFGTYLFVPWAAIVALLAAFHVRRSGRDTMKLLGASSFVFFFMIVVSSLIRMDSGVPSHILMFSIYSDEQPAGVPLLFYDGIVIQSPALVLTISLPTMLIYPLISIAIAENYLWIFRSYSGGGRLSSALSGAGAVLGCQCESITAVMPSLAALLISIIVIPLLVESLVLVLLTTLTLFLLLSHRRGFIRLHDPAAKRGMILRAMSYVFILSIPFIEIYGLIIGLVHDETFFFGINFLMFIEGAIVGTYLISILQSGKPGRHSLIWILLSTFLLLIWYIPSLVMLATEVPAYYVLMNLSSLGAGLLIATPFSAYTIREKIVLLEYITMMFSMSGIVLLYATSFNILVWSAFTLASQFYLSIILTIMSLPIMWYITNLSLVVNASWEKDFHIISAD